MKEKQKTLTIYYHCHASCPQLVTYCDIVDSLEDYKYPVKESPVIVSLNQEIPYLGADLEEKTTIKTIRYIVGKVEPANMTLNFNFDYEAEEFLEKNEYQEEQHYEDNLYCRVEGWYWQDHYHNNPCLFITG